MLIVKLVKSSPEDGNREYFYTDNGFVGDRSLARRFDSEEQAALILGHWPQAVTEAIE